MKRPYTLALPPLLALSALVLGPSIGSAQSLLLTAKDFVLLGGTGVTVAGAGPDVFSNGNVGSAASIAGFPPATVVNGSTILGGPVVAQALLDLGTARNALTAMATTTNLTGQDLSQMTLTPGVYKFNVAAAITLSGTKILTLDAQGKNNVVWVFNIGTSLTTAAGAQIQFINLGSNGGRDNALFWNAGTAITFGATNVIAGNYLAGTDITFGTTVPSTGSGSGRALAAAIVSFDGSATMDVLGAPGGGDLSGSLTITNGVATPTGYVLLSAAGSYVVGGSSPVRLIPGTLFSTANATISGNSADAGLTPATLTVFHTIATLTGTNTYTGGTIVDSGTLTVGSANLPTNGAVSLIDSNATGTSGVLIFNQSTDGTFGGVISGTGGIIKDNAGTLTITGTNTFTGGTLINAGALALQGGTIGTTSIASGAFLRGNGTINGNLLNNGTVSPGFSPGTIVVTGNFTQGAGGTLIMEFASAISRDQLLISGSATLDGTVQLKSLGGFNLAGQSFTLLTAAGGVTGQFATVISSAAVTANLTYLANDVNVAFTQTAFTTFAQTPNQTAVAAAAQNSPALTAALNVVPLASQMPGALNALSPQGYQIWSDIAFAHARSLSDRLGHDRGAILGHDNYYFQVGQSHNRVNGDADVNPTQFDSNSGLVGGDHAISDTLTVGAFLEYTESDTDLGSGGSHSNVKNIMPGLRALWKKDGWFANASVAYGFDQYESTRMVSFPGTAATAESSTRGQQWMADFTAGHRFIIGPVTVSPFAGLLASGWKAKGFTESGAGAFDATVRDQTAHSLSTQAGLEGSLNLALGTVRVSPRLRGAWIHELANDSRSMDAAFGSVVYTISTRKPQIDSARLSAGMDVAFTERLALFADYAVQTGDRMKVVGAWSAGLSYGF